MFKILFAMNGIVIIASLLFSLMEINHFRNDKNNNKCIKYILGSSSISGIGVIIGAALFVPTFFPM